MALLIRVFVCIMVTGLCLYRYIDKQNELTELRLEIPQVAKELQQIREENQRLQYQIDYFESPIHLMELADKPSFSHLKHPYLKEVITLPKSSNDGERSKHEG